MEKTRSRSKLGKAAIVSTLIAGGITGADATGHLESVTKPVAGIVQSVSETFDQTRRDSLGVLQKLSKESFPSPFKADPVLGLAIAVNDNGNPIITPDGSFLLNDKKQVLEINPKPYESRSNPNNKLLEIRIDRPSQGSESIEATRVAIQSRYGVVVVGNLTNATSKDEQRFVVHEGEKKGPYDWWIMFTDDSGNPVNPTTNKPQLDGNDNAIPFYLGRYQIASKKPLQRTMTQQFHGTPNPSPEPVRAGK